MTPAGLNKVLRTGVVASWKPNDQKALFGRETMNIDTAKVGAFMNFGRIREKFF